MVFDGLLDETALNDHPEVDGNKMEGQEFFLPQGTLEQAGRGRRHGR